MGEILGLGLSHYPNVMGTDADMANILRRNLQRPDVPDEWKDPSRWPEAMQREWADDKAAAAQHRDSFVGNLRRIRQELDDFKPDLIVVWGDDQYENFREDVVPAFCVYAWGDTDSQPFARFGGGRGPAPENIWNEPADKTFKIRNNVEASKYLAKGLLKEKFDIAYSYEPLHYEGLSHAFHRVPIYLDYDRIGFDYPIVPVAVNCYGSRVVVNHGGSFPVGSIEVPEGDLDPPSPSPERCMELGAAVARVMRESPWRVALLASSSWSHAFLVPKHYFMYPDVSSDRKVYEMLKAGDYDAMRKWTTEDIEDSGQQEVLNWFCLAGAMEELDRKPDHIEFVETHIFNSNKVFAVYDDAR